jgi:ell wall binding domain 2 (CWB2)
MRVPSLRLLAALALAGALLVGAASGCGKGSATHSAQSGETSAPPAAHGVVDISTKNTTRLGGSGVQSDAAAVAQAVYPGFTPATRPQAVVLVNEREWPAALAASALASAPLGAPILYAEGNTLPAASERALIAMRPVGAASLGGAQVIRIGTTAALPDNYKARTIPGGTGEASVAVAVQRLLDSSRGKAANQAIVLASDAPRALQMPLAELAAESGAPILFVTSAGVPAATRKALEALSHPAIYVAAPTTLHASAYAALAHLGTVVHISGEAGTGEAAEGRASSNPVENAISVSRFSRGAFGWGIHEAGHGLVFANVARPLDAPAAAPLSAHGDYGPLLLLEHSASVPSALTHYLSDIEPGYTTAVPPVREVYNHGWLIGDESAISALAQAELDTVLEIAPRQPSAGEQSVAEAE